MNRLIHQRAATFHSPASLNRPSVILGGTKPLYVCVALNEAPEASLVDGALQKQRRIVEAMLAHDSQKNSGGSRRFHHLVCGREVGRNRLLDLNVFARVGAFLQRLKTKIGE